MSAPVATDAAQEYLDLTLELVAAIRKLSRSELLERGLEMRLRRGAPGRRPAVDLVDAETGGVLDEVPTEDVWRMMAELEKKPEGEL